MQLPQQRRERARRLCFCSCGLAVAACAVCNRATFVKQAADGPRRRIRGGDFRAKTLARAPRPLTVL